MLNPLDVTGCEPPCTSRHHEHIRNISDMQQLISLAQFTPVLRPVTASCRLERHASAVGKNRAVGLLARCAVIDAAAVAAIQPRFGAKPPNRVLHEPREIRRESRVKTTRIDLTGDTLE